MRAKTTESLAVKILKYAIKAIVSLVVFGTIGFFLWRVFSSGNPKDLEKLTPNAPLRDACLAAEERGERLLVLTQFQEDYITSVPGKNYGYFAITDAKFIPDADQVQILFRYNNSTIRHLKEDYKLDKMPDRDDDLYDVTLYVIYDLTPDVTSDNDGSVPEAIEYVRYHATTSVADKKNLYNYRKFIFDGVEQASEAKTVLSMYVDFYYVGDVNYQEEAYGALPVYYADKVSDPYEPGRKELEVIRKFK